MQKIAISILILLPATIAANQVICNAIVQTMTVEHVIIVERLDIFREIAQKDWMIVAYVIVVEKQAIYLVTAQWGRKNMKILQPATDVMSPVTWPVIVQREMAIFVATSATR